MYDDDDFDPWTPDGYEHWLWLALTGPDELPRDRTPLLIGADWFTDDAADNAARAEELSEAACFGDMRAQSDGTAAGVAGHQADSLATFLLWVAAPARTPAP